MPNPIPDSGNAKGTADPPALRPQRAAQGEEDGGGDGRADGLQHDRGFGDADEHEAGDDQLQRRQPQRRGAEEPVGDQRCDQQAFASRALQDTTRDRRRQDRPEHRQTTRQQQDECSKTACGSIR
ncbi:hypothetical protein GCM10009634_68200 [Saccharothrix xinjiangensis]